MTKDKDVTPAIQRDFFYPSVGTYYDMLCFLLRSLNVLIFGLLRVKTWVSDLRPETRMWPLASNVIFYPPVGTYYEDDMLPLLLRSLNVFICGLLRAETWVSDLWPETKMWPLPSNVIFLSSCGDLLWRWHVAFPFKISQCSYLWPTENGGMGIWSKARVWSLTSNVIFLIFLWAVSMKTTCCLDF